MPDTILVSEIFGPTLQGEGALIGKPTVFVRTGACDFRCTWCDTLYAVLPQYRKTWQPLAAAAILDEVMRLSGDYPMLVTISGGNPALQPLAGLLDLGHARGLTFALETQGSVARDWFAQLDHLVLSPKPPSSDMKTDWQKLADCVAAAGSQTRTVLKIVIFDALDYAYARGVHAKFPQLPVYLQIGTPAVPLEPPISATPINDAPHNSLVSRPPLDVPGITADVPGITAQLEWLLAQVITDGWQNVTVLPQLHVLLWGHKRGV